MYLLKAPTKKFQRLHNVAPICEEVKFFHNYALCSKQFYAKIHCAQGFVDVTPPHMIKDRKQKQFQSILFITKGGIGDVLWVMPVIKAIRELHPKALIAVSTEPKSAAVFEQFPYINFTVKNEIWSIQNLIRTSDEVFDFGGIATVFKKLMRMDPIDATFTEAGLQLPKTKKDGRPHIVVTADEGKRAEALLRRKGIDPSGKQIVAIVTNASTPNRDWPMSYIRTLTQMFLNDGQQVVWLSERENVKNSHSTTCKCGYEISFSTSEEDLDLVAECPACHERVTIRKFTTGKDFANFASSTNIRQVMSIIALCDLVVSPVTAPLVMATSFEIPTVGLFGAFSTKNRTKYYDKFLAVEGKTKCRPCAEHWTECKLGNPAPCMKSILPEEVFAAGKKLLTKYPRSVAGKLATE